MTKPTASPDGKPAPMNTVDACNHELARDALRELLALRQEVERLTREPLSEPAIDAALAAFYSQMKFPDRDPARREDMRRAISAALALQPKEN